MARSRQKLLPGTLAGQYAIPVGAAIWIELTASSSGLATYSGYGRFGSYTPIFGTAGSPRLWKWSGVMVHNTYAFFRPGADPYGFIPGRQFALSRPGLYGLEFRVVDTSTNGPAGQPIRAASERYDVCLQAGFAIACLSRDLTSATALFGGESGRSFYLESTSALDPPVSWLTVAGPLQGTNCLQSLTDPRPRWDPLLPDSFPITIARFRDAVVDGS